MAAPMVCVLCALVMLKPQEFIPILAGLPIVHIFFVLCLAAGGMDLVLGRLRLSVAPHVPLTIAFFVWGALVTFVRNPRTFSQEVASLIIVFCVFGAVAFLSGTGKGLRHVCTVYLLSALFASVIAILQADGPLGCMMAAPTDWEARDVLEYDGRPCETSIDCRKDPPVWNANYRCEHVGPLGTSTIAGRVRYRGTLADPNDLSLAAALALPFALALSERISKQKQPEGGPSIRHDGGSFIGRLFRTLAVLAVIATVGTMIIYSQSRMGVLVFLVVLAMALLRRAGMWGVVLGCILLPPVLMFGGRDSAEAEASSKERLELIADALSMVRRSQGLGVGMGRFAAESSAGLTAHNSYLLAASELGIIGISLFALMLYAGLKVPFSLWFGKYELGRDTARLAPAIAITLGGACVGIFFLSWAYKEILYILLGASAALYQAARAEDPNIRVTLSAREVVIVIIIALAFVPCVYAGVRILG
jgi:hypothetical protein